MVDSKFKRWFEKAHTLLQSVGVEDITIPQRVGRQTQRNNVPGKYIIRELWQFHFLTILLNSLTVASTKKAETVLNFYF